MKPHRGDSSSAYRARAEGEGEVRGREAIIVGFLLSGGSAMAQGDRLQCNEAIDSYNRATSEIAESLRRYSSCVNYSRGRSGCEEDFRRLKSAQENFQLAVALYISGNCER